MEQIKKNNHPHDDFFRTIFYKPERTAALLRLAAQNNPGLAEFMRIVDFSTMTEISESYIGGDDKGTADLAFTVRLNTNAGVAKDAKLLVGIIEEHKSYKDVDVFRQLIRYWFGLMVIKQENIPTVALIVYNGKQKWKPSEQTMFPDYPKYFHQIRLPFICEFLDVGETPDSNIRAEIDGVTKFALLLMKYAFEPEALQSHIEEAREAIFSIPETERLDILKKTFIYLQRIFKPNDRRDFMDFITHKDVYGTPSLYDVLEEEYVNAHKDEWRTEGIIEGKAEGIIEGKAEGSSESKREVAKKLLEMGKLTISEISQITDLSEEELNHL